jgi:[ribosomal protein S5]-alanine N-acetyltransferase
MSHIVFQTPHLRVRRATAEDASFIYSLWTSPDVMQFVGFPQGLNTSVDEVQREIETTGHADFGSRLIVEQIEDGTRIGQAKLGTVDADGVSEPDIKLHPDSWGRGWGSELWAALIDYTFRHSEASIVQGTPNRNNTASVRMQRGAGMVKVGEGEFANHADRHPGSVSVPYYKMQITRSQWMSRQASRSGDGKEATE